MTFTSWLSLKGRCCVFVGYCHRLKTNYNCADDCVVLFDDGVYLFYVLQIELHYVPI